MIKKTSIKLNNKKIITKFGNKVIVETTYRTKKIAEVMFLLEWYEMKKLKFKWDFWDYKTPKTVNNKLSLEENISNFILLIEQRIDQLV